ncbi:16S rRNA (cytosine(1402)-N(4))-methyltransferase RsmH [bacterium]|nr:16S rRNA (cytosine(1402)-N(4))-methyltransferase RsmH [bacterium]
MENYGHVPVLLNEVIDALRLKKGKVIVDCTLGCGGHAEAILEKIYPEGKLVGIDRDQQVLDIASKRLERFGKSFIAVKENYKNCVCVLRGLNIDKVDGVLLDLGVSSVQIDESFRGFSFKNNADLDMRMDRSQDLDAKYVVNNYPEVELADLIYKLGDERRSRRIAREIVVQREKKQITTTEQLADIVARAYGFYGKKIKIHPATRTFQALRIFVNGELTALQEFLDSIMTVLNEGACVCVISYHSLEDRIVKFVFKDFVKNKQVELLTKKPMIPTDEEINNNKRARSAKMRVMYKI